MRAKPPHARRVFMQQRPAHPRTFADASALGVRPGRLSAPYEVGEAATEAVELPDDEHVARPERAHAAVKPRPVVADTGRAVLVDVAGVNARGLQGVSLQVQRLGAVRLRDAGVADQHVW